MSKALAQELEPIQEEEKAEEVTQEASEKPAEDEKPEGEAEAKAEGEKEPEKPKKDFVPHQAFHEERERRKQLQAELVRVQQAQEQQRQILEQRFAQMQQAWQQQMAPKPPAYEEDPLGNVKHTLDATQAELAALREHQAAEYRRQQDEYQRAQYANRVASAVNQAEAEYISENPDYLEAVNHLKGLRAKQLEAFGWDQAAIVNYVQNEAFQIAEAALQRGQNPAEVAFKMAVASGWAKKEAKPAPEQKIETLQKGVKASHSLGAGGTPTGKLTVDAVANMSDDEFDDFMKSGGWNKLG